MLANRLKGVMSKLVNVAQKALWRKTLPPSHVSWRSFPDNPIPEDHMSLVLHESVCLVQFLYQLVARNFMI